MKFHLRTALGLSLAFAEAVLAQQTAWGQCGGNGWSGPTSCVSNYCCNRQNEWYFQCIPCTNGGGGGGSSTQTTMVTTTATSGGGGTQPTYVASEYIVDSSLPGHTIYKPKDMKAFAKMPVLVWGNGACSADSLSHRNFLLEIASWGIIAIASGTPGGGGSTNSGMMKTAIDWAVSHAGSGNYANMDASRVAAAGMSCGGVEAYDQSQDSRVKAIGIFNSGQMSASGTQQVVPRIKFPIFYFLGGPSDIAYNNGMRDYAAVSSGVPSWVGNYPVGHGGTYGDPKGGKFGTAGQHFFRWVLRGDSSAASYFTGNGAQSDGWTVQSKSLNNLQTTPI